ncbi:MAG: hypothetical protein IIA35_01280 [Proteobacteria bacterium]|nr:hypothetical protein [Pseudomonadota bacterium]
MPGFVDCHTHACWAGERFDEFEMKLAGRSYLEILAAGGGIMSTVRAVRAADLDTLARGLLLRLARMAALGSTTVEVKSGYGLTTADELKMLRAIRVAAGQAAQAIRGGSGPRFIECKTYRWREHVGPGEDYDDGYRTRDELEAWQARDQVAATGAMLDDAERQAIDDEVEGLIAEAVDFADQSPWPEPEELYSHVFAD